MTAPREPGHDDLGFGATQAPGAAPPVGGADLRSLGVGGTLDAPAFAALATGRSPSPGADRAAQAPAGYQLAAGARFGPCVLVRPLGRGGMGEVWLAARRP
jgi:hypothetical protein